MWNYKLTKIVKINYLNITILVGLKGLNFAI